MGNNTTNNDMRLSNYNSTNADRAVSNAIELSLFCIIIACVVALLIFIIVNSVDMSRNGYPKITQDTNDTITLEEDEPTEAWKTV